MPGYGLPCYIILRELETALRGLATPEKGLVVVAHDPAQALIYLANAPQQWRVIIGVDDEASPEEPYSFDGVSNTQFFFIIQAGLGLPADPGAQIHKERTDSGASVLELAEAVRLWVRGLSFTHVDLDCHFGFSWRTSTWASVQQEGKPVCYGRQHVFTLQHRISNPAALTPVAIVHP